MNTPNGIAAEEPMLTTIFTWGYHGWGNHTPRLIEAVDAVEAARGFAPPVFVDIRIRRSVRAKGFQGSTFEKLLGPQRHRWLKALGNRFIETRQGPSIQIADPSAADQLLALAIELAHERRRLLFFCGCQWPRLGGEIHCHRASVAELVLQAARRRSVAVEVVEWPGGQPKPFDLEVPAQVLAAVRKGRLSVPLGDRPNLAELAGLPWCSIATLTANGANFRRIVGPAIAQPRGWALPVLSESEANADVDEIRREAERLRENWGLRPAVSLR